MTFMTKRIFLLIAAFAIIAAGCEPVENELPNDQEQTETPSDPDTPEDPGQTPEDPGQTEEPEQPEDPVTPVEGDKLTGTVIGSTYSVDYNNGNAQSTTVNTKDNVFDGKFDTFFASYTYSLPSTPSFPAARHAASEP